MREPHKPKFISSDTGLGLPTNTITREFITPNRMISTELWNEMSQPWSESGVIIAKPGYKWITEWVESREFIVTRFIDSENNLVAHYLDICTPIERKDKTFTFYDLYLDVWVPAGKNPLILDEDELTEALNLQFITSNQATQAKMVAEQVINNLQNIINFPNH